MIFGWRVHMPVLCHYHRPLQSTVMHANFWGIRITALHYWLYREETIPSTIGGQHASRPDMPARHFFFRLCL
jgi:hypothetical protein